MSANELTKQILEYLLERNVFAWRQNTGGVFDPRTGRFRTAAKKGISDILGILPNGVVIAVEVKWGKDRLSPEQEGFLACIKRQNGIAMVARTFDQFAEEFEKEYSRAIGS